MIWRCGHDEAEGLSVLAIARPGLQYDSTLVPREVFYDWIDSIGERMLRGYAAFPNVREHELQMLTEALLTIRPAFEPVREEAERFQFMASLANIGFLTVVHGDRPDAMARCAQWIVRALEWATKHHSRDRRCPHEPPTLAAEAVEIWGTIAEYNREDPEDARRQERELQFSTLVDLVG